LLNQRQHDRCVQLFYGQLDKRVLHLCVHCRGPSLSDGLGVRHPSVGVGIGRRQRPHGFGREHGNVGLVRRPLHGVGRGCNAVSVNDDLQERFSRRSRLPAVRPGHSLRAWIPAAAAWDGHGHGHVYGREFMDREALGRF
jgi:hypothetical protein